MDSRPDIAVSVGQASNLGPVYSLHIISHAGSVELQAVKLEQGWNLPLLTNKSISHVRQPCR